jgi:hypothetical protein
MLRLPSRFAKVILAFVPVFVQQRTWCHARLLLLGALLAPGQRTVSSILWIIGLRQERHFVKALIAIQGGNAVHATRASMRVLSKALPRRRALCTNWKKPR